LHKLGMIIGSGRLPLVAARSARRQGWSPQAVAVVPDFAEELASEVDSLHRIPVGQWQRIIEVLKGAGVQAVALVGKVSKRMFFGDLQPDERFRRVIAAASDASDDTLLRAFAGDLEREGMQIHSQVELLPHLLTPAGVLTSDGPGEGEWRDVQYGFRMAREIGRLDVGQSLVVKSLAVLAVEAVEGTDAAIRRGGRLGGPGAVVVKVAKPGQDLRFDVPAAGRRTVATMASVGARVLALEAGRTFMLEREKMLADAEAAGIVVIGVDGDSEHP